MKKIIRFIAFIIMALMPSAMNAQWGYPTFADMFQQAFGVPLESRKNTKNTEPIEEEYQYESNGFVWIELSQYDPSNETFYYGAKDESGKTIIPLYRRYTRIYFQEEDGCIGYFSVSKGDDTEGACSINGSVIISPGKYSIVYTDQFSKRRENSDWIETGIRLSAEGKVIRKASNSYDSYDNYYAPYGTTFTPTYDGGNSSSDYGTTPQERLNQTVGSECLTCHGTGKCPTCHGSKVTSSFGNTYKCTVCDEAGNCPVCHGSGKSSWNR